MKVELEKKDCKIIPFKTKEQKMAEVRFRHLSDHLDDDPCFKCQDVGSLFCIKECKSKFQVY
jgi:hypothetical protein